MFDNCYQYLLSRIAVCESAKELNKLTCVWPCSLTEDEISSLEEAKRLLLNIIVRERMNEPMKVEFTEEMKRHVCIADPD